MKGYSQMSNPDKFTELFQQQAQLNKRTGFDPDQLRKNFDPQTAGIWINNYLAAMSKRGGGTARLHFLEALVLRSQRRQTLYDPRFAERPG